MSSTALIVRDNSTLSITFSEAALKAKESALSESALIGVVRNATTQEIAVESQRKLKTLLRRIEDARVEVKEPVLKLCRTIDERAKEFRADVEDEEKRIAGLIAAYQEEQREIARRAEVERQIELQRIENERLEAIAEANRKAQEAAIAEAKAKAEAERVAREAAEAEARAKAEAERKIREAKDAESRAKAEAEAKAREIEAEKARAKAKEVALEAEAKAAIERARAEEVARAIEVEAKRRLDAVPAPVMPMKADGQIVREEYDFEVTDIWLLAKMHPGFVRIEPNRQEIKEALKRGIREVKGLRIFQVTKSSVRAERSQKLIEV